MIFEVWILFGMVMAYLFRARAGGGAQQSLVSAEHAILVIIGYGLAFLIIAGVLVRRRDVA